MSTDPRARQFDRLDERARFDLVVIGGGATGLGVAVDAAARGLSVALFERQDFAKGTSSRATKLLHGGVRYLAQGNIALVREALRERGTILHNAPHLSRALAFVMPLYGRRGGWFERWFYGAGLKAYDLLAGRQALAGARHLDRREALAALPGVRPDGLAGAIQYWDGQFDDARLALALARTAEDLGAVVLNHCPVVGLIHDGADGADGNVDNDGAGGASGRVAGVRITDALSGRRREVSAGTVVNATGVWVDALRHLDEPEAAPMVSPSQGIHLVVDRDFLPGDAAMLVPRTADGRVLFAVPWHGKVLLGTTDTPRADLPIEPQPLAGEIDFVLGESARYLARPPRLADVRSCWVGLRPLVRSAGKQAEATRRISREHAVVVSDNGLVTVTGGKWTTYRAMAEDVLEVCMARAGLPPRPAGATRNLRLHGAPSLEVATQPMQRDPAATLGLAAIDPAERAAMPSYGTDAPRVAALPGADRRIAPGLTEAMVRYAVRHEYARDIEDVLARRSRLLFLDARAAADAAEAVAAILGDELGPAFDATAAVSAFRLLARHYLPHSQAPTDAGADGAGEVAGEAGRAAGGAAASEVTGKAAPTAADGLAMTRPGPVSSGNRETGR